MNEGDENGALPEGWASAPISSVFDSWGGLTPSKAEPEFWNGDMPWASSQDIKLQVLTTTTHAVTSRALNETRLRVCPAGTALVVVRSGILAHTLPVAITSEPVVINQDLKAFDSRDATLNAWLAVWLRSEESRILGSNRRDGTTVQSVQYSLLKQRVLPIAPPSEQRRILTRLDELDRRREAATAHLTAGSAIVNRFRGAVLAAAGSGRLTQDWRETHPDAISVEPALANVLAQARRKRATPSGDFPLPPVPATYLVSTVGAASQRIEYGTSRRATAHGDIPVLRMTNIQGGRLHSAELKYVEEDAEIAALRLQDGDLLFNRTNSPQLVGKSAVFRETRPMTFASYLIRVRVAPDVADPDFVNYWLNSSWGRAWAHHVKTDGVSQSNINATKLAAMPLPLPPLQEQREIVRRADALLAIADRLSVQVGRAETTLERIRKGSLAKAFRGELVATEGALAAHEHRDYESADQLLERIGATETP